MRLDRSARLLAAWMAGLALLLATLAPTLALAMAERAAPGWAEICSAQAAATVKADPGAARDDAAHGHAFEHCPLCCMQPHDAGLPPASTPPLPRPAQSHAVPAGFPPAPCAPSAGANAQPRAPPVRS